MRKGLRANEGAREDRELLGVGLSEAGARGGARRGANACSAVERRGDAARCNGCAGIGAAQAAETIPLRRAQILWSRIRRGAYVAERKANETSKTTDSNTRGGSLLPGSGVGSNVAATACIQCDRRHDMTN